MPMSRIEAEFDKGRDKLILQKQQQAACLQRKKTGISRRAAEYSIV